MKNLPSYTEYKPTVANWLEPIPNHWQCKRLKFTVRLIAERIDSSLSNLPFVGLEHIESWTGRRIYDDGASSESSVSRFEPCDVLFGKLRPYLAKVHLAEEAGTCTGEMLVLRSGPELVPKYLRYFIGSSDFIKNINSSSYGTKMPRANWEFIGDQIQLLPPIEEQNTIIEFLDKQTAQLDALLAHQKDLLVLLAEKRMAFITQAVMRGLDVNVPRRKLHDEWFDEIPAHWGAKRLRFLSNRVKTGGTPSSSGPDYFEEEGISWYTPGDFDGSLSLKPASKKLAHEAFDTGNAVLFSAGSVMLVGIGATLGKVAVSDDICSANQQINSVLPVNTLNNYYLAYFLTAINKEIKLMSNASTIGILNQDKTKQLFVLQPPYKEQEHIVQFLKIADEENRKSKELITKSIKKIKEYRAALITAAVTGQIDVRAAVTAEAA